MDRLYFWKWRRQEAGCGCEPAGKPSSFNSVTQHQFFAFHSNSLHTNRDQPCGTRLLKASEGRILKVNFHKFLGGDIPGQYPLREGIPHPASTTSTAFHVAQALHCWSADHRAPYRSYGAPLVQEHAPGAATDSWTDHTDNLIAFYTILECHRQTDGRVDCRRLQYRAL